jgi:ankyrin repeat protein
VGESHYSLFATDDVRCGWCVLQHGFTALMRASEKGHTAIVQDLLEAGADRSPYDAVRVLESSALYPIVC